MNDTQFQEERDRRYSERFESIEKMLTKATEESKAAVKSALDAAKELTAAAFASSEKAITKAEAAQTSYNERTNELRGTLNDQAKMMMTRTESEARFAVLEEKINEIKKDISSLRESRSLGSGQQQATIQEHTDSRWDKDNRRTIIIQIVGWIIVVGIALFIRK